MRLYKKHLTTLLTWGLLLLLLLLWGQFILFPKHRSVAVQSASAPPTLVTGITSRPAISGYHLFGDSATTETHLDLSNAGETGLDLIITGIFASNDSQQGLAYIRSPGGQEEKFEVGQKVFDLAELTAIYPDYVLLKRQGQQEKLSLSKNRLQSTTRPPSNDAGITDKAEVAERNRQFINSGESWQETLNKTKYDPAKIAKIVGNVSVVHNSAGQIAGLRVSSLSGSDALLKQGLQRNDRITAINGVTISSENILTIKQQLEQNDQATVTVNRNGREISLNLNLSELQP